MAVHHDITMVSHQGKKALGLVIIILITGVGMITIMTTTEVITIVAVR